MLVHMAQKITHLYLSFVRMIQQSFIDMENMFELLEENQEVKNIDEAPPLQVIKGMIEFDNVSFHYNPQ